jgi:hypothetical protein
MTETNEEERIKKAFQRKDWPEIKVSDSWATFKIMAEFVEGFEKMSKIGPCVSIFGSARTKSDNPYYLLSEEIARKLVHAGFGVITGGGPGIMEAGNKGAFEAAVCSDFGGDALFGVCLIASADVVVAPELPSRVGSDTADAAPLREAAASGDEERCSVVTVLPAAAAAE